MFSNIYLYNPTCELAVANGDVNYVSPKALRAFVRELGVLPLYFGSCDDVVLVEQLPPAEFSERLNQAGIPVPEFRLLAHALTDLAFLEQPKEELLPWGWSPATHKLLEPLKERCSHQYKMSSNAQWSEMQKQLFGRETALLVLKDLLTHSATDWMPPLTELPERCTTHDEVMALQQRWRRVVTKAPWSASGRGLQILRPEEYNQTNRQVISGILKQQGYVIAGPWYQKLADLSFHFFAHGDGRIEFRGQASFITDEAGRYQGNYIDVIPDHLSDEQKKFIEAKSPAIIRGLEQALLTSPLAKNYRGWLGIDSILYHDEAGQLRIHPCLEINCRLNMGALTLKLRESLHEGATGSWRIGFFKPGTLPAFDQEQTAKYPLKMVNGKIVRGYLPLSPVWPKGKAFAWMIVE